MHDLFAVQASQDSQERRDDTLEGIVVAGSWNPAEATIDVMVGDTYALSADSPDEYLPLTATLATSQIGDSHGPIGGERAMLWRCANGWIAKLEHGPDDSPNVPAGERWIQHRSLKSADSTPIWDVGIKLSNDGAQTGDAKGGLTSGGGSLAKTFTAGGHSDTLDDHAQTITRQTAGGHKQIFDDAGRIISIVTSNGLIHKWDDAARQIVTIAGGAKTIHDAAVNAISHIVPTGGGVGLGKLWSDLSAANAAMHHTHISSFSTSFIQDTMQSQVTAMATALVTAATGAANPLAMALAFKAATTVAGWVAGQVTLPTIPLGSSLARIAD